MIKPTHMPNKIEIFLAFILIGIALLSTKIIFSLLVSTDNLSLMDIIGLFVLLFLALLIGIQSIFNIFYLKSQRK